MCAGCRLLFSFDVARRFDHMTYQQIFGVIKQYTENQDIPLCSPRNSENNKRLDYCAINDIRFATVTMHVIVIDHISVGGNAIASVCLSIRPSVRPFVSILFLEPTDP